VYCVEAKHGIDFISNDETQPRLLPRSGFFYLYTMTYGDKLKDERWIKKRLSILEKDGFKCKNCLSRLNLQVHHKAYLSGADPWQYPDYFLITLCEVCHSEEEYYKKAIKEYSDSLSLKGIPYQDIYKHLQKKEINGQR